MKPMANGKHVLVLEDNPRVIAVLQAKLPYSLTILSSRREAEEYLETHPKEMFDAVLLDRNDANDESFHDVDLSRFDPKTIIAISSVPRHNESARRLGITHTVTKEYYDIEASVERIARKLAEILPNVIP